MTIQRQTGKGKPTIWRWQARFMAEGVEGLLHEATRPPGKPPLTPATIEQVVYMLTNPVSAQHEAAGPERAFVEPLDRLRVVGGFCQYRERKVAHGWCPNPKFA